MSVEYLSYSAGFEVLTAVKSAAFGVVTQGTPIEVNWHFGGRNQKQTGLLLCLLILLFEREDGCSSFLETVNLYRTTRRHMPEDGTLLAMLCSVLSFVISLIGCQSTTL
jgi:hypothetical protein